MPYSKEKKYNLYYMQQHESHRRNIEQNKPYMKNIFMIPFIQN